MSIFHYGDDLKEPSLANAQDGRERIDRQTGTSSVIFEEWSLFRVFRLLVIIIVAMGAAIGYRWHRYVSNTESPYDEVGIELNSRMPGPINKWGCDMLHATFGSNLPPYGCQDGSDPR